MTSCEVSGVDCRAPAGYGVGGSGWAPGDRSARGTCVRCGGAVCGAASCSTRRTVDGRRERICRPCEADYDRATRRDAGYTDA